LERPIKETGEFTVNVRLHSDVQAGLKLTVTAKNAKAPAAAEADGDHEGGSRPRGRTARREEETGA
jgi:hypothetical protein